METTTENETTVDGNTSVGVTRQASNLLDLMVASIRPRPTKASLLSMLIEQEAERRGLNAQPESATSV